MTPWSDRAGCAARRGHAPARCGCGGVGLRLRGPSGAVVRVLRCERGDRLLCRVQLGFRPGRCAALPAQAPCNRSTERINVPDERRDGRVGVLAVLQSADRHAVHPRPAGHLVEAQPLSLALALETAEELEEVETIPMGPPYLKNAGVDR